MPKLLEAKVADLRANPRHTGAKLKALVRGPSFAPLKLEVTPSLSQQSPVQFCSTTRMLLLCLRQGVD